MQNRNETDKSLNKFNNEVCVIRKYFCRLQWKQIMEKIFFRFLNIKTVFTACYEQKKLCVLNEITCKR